MKDPLLEMFKKPALNTTQDDGGMLAFGEALKESLDWNEMQQRLGKTKNTNNTGAMITAGLAGAVAGYFAVDAFRPIKYLNDNGKIHDWS